MSKTDNQPANEKLWSQISKLRGLDFRRPEQLAEFLKKENVHFSAHDLMAFGLILATRFGRSAGMSYVPEWLAGVFSALIDGVSCKTICDPWAGIGLLIGILREASMAKTVIAFTPNNGELSLGQVIVPEVDWQVGNPLHLIDAIPGELDVVASILPMGARTNHPLKLILPFGDVVELNDDLGNLILVAASMRLSPSGIGLFVVTPSFFFSVRSVFRRFSELGLGIQAALALPSGTFAPYTNIPAYLVIVRRKPFKRMFVAQLSANTNTNLQIIGNLRQETEGCSLELGRFVNPESFRSIEYLRAEETFALAEKRFGSPSVRLTELATAINLGRSDDKFAFHPLENAIYVPLIGNSNVVESLNDLTLKPQNYAQVVIDSALSNAQFVARFLNSEFGKQLRDNIKTGMIPKLNKQTLKELRMFVPALSTQSSENTCNRDEHYHRAKHGHVASK